MSPVAISSHGCTAKLFAASRAALFIAALSAAIFPAGATPVAKNPGAEALKLSIERLYSLPRLIGTAPTGFAWSSDGRYLAFLWNDEGYNFRDVWIVDVEDPDLAPERITRMPHTDLAEHHQDPVDRAMALERAQGDPGVTSVIWHPDGQHLLIRFRADLWLIARGTEPRQLTETEAAESQPAYSPDGKMLAYVHGGDLWITSADTASAAVTDAVRSPTRRTSLAVAEGTRLDVHIARFAWSPDGRTIAVLEADRRGVALRGIPDYLSDETTLPMIRRAYPGEEPVRQRLGLLKIRSQGGAIESSASKWLRLADEAPDMLLDFAWSPNGAHLAVDTSDLYAKDRRIYIVDTALDADTALGADTASGKVTRDVHTSRLVASDREPENETFYFWRIAWSTDSQSLYFLSDRDEDYHVYAVAAASSAASPPGSRTPRRLTRGAWAVAEMHPVEGGLMLVGNRGQAEERQLFRLDDRVETADHRGDGDARPVRVSQRPGTHAPVVSPDGRHAAVAFSSDDTPPDLWLTALGERRAERRVTRSPIGEFARYRWVTPRYVTFSSHVDGTTLHGRLTLPPDFDSARTYPAILGSVYTDSVRNQWGGRTAHPTWGLDQYLAREGYILLNVDMRGSWGRGRAHRRGIRLDYGGMDIEDLASGVRFLQGLGYVDDERIGIWGSSYGGLMTAMSLFRKPGLYAAGVAGAPATNVWHALTGQMAVMMRPEDQPEEYADSSPFMHAAGLEDPLMIIHGMRDRVVLFKDSVTLMQRLLMLDKDVDLVALPDAGHGWDNEGLAQTRFAFRKLVQHFDRYLKVATSAGK